MNATCPQCGYVIHRVKHANIGAVRFCRNACMWAWMGAHGLAVVHQRDAVPISGDRRRSA